MEVFCKKSWSFRFKEIFTKGKYYQIKIYTKSLKEYHIYGNDRDFYSITEINSKETVYIPLFKRHFYTIPELRKIKIDKLFNE